MAAPQGATGVNLPPSGVGWQPFCREGNPWVSGGDRHRQWASTPATGLRPDGPIWRRPRAWTHTSRLAWSTAARVDWRKKGGFHAAFRNPSRPVCSTQVPWRFRAQTRAFERPLPGLLVIRIPFSTAPDQPENPDPKRPYADRPGVLSRIRVALIYKILFNQLLALN